MITTVSYKHNIFAAAITVCSNVSPSASYEYLCYGCTATIKFVILSVRGPSLYVRI